MNDTLARPLSPAPAASRPAAGVLPVAIDADGARMLLNFTHLERVVRRAHSLPEAYRPALIGRLKYMQQLGLPHATKERRYDKKPTLGMDDSLKVMLAFEFLQAGMAPVRAVRLAASDWEEFRRGAAEAWTEPTSERGLAFFEPRALAEFDRAGVSTDEPLNELLGARSAKELARDAAAREDGGPASSRLLVIDTRRLLHAFADAVAAEAIAPRRDVERALSAWCTDVIGGAALPEWDADPEFHRSDAAAR